MLTVHVVPITRRTLRSRDPERVSALFTLVNFLYGGASVMYLHVLYRFPKIDLRISFSAPSSRTALKPPLISNASVPFLNSALRCIAITRMVFTIVLSIASTASASPRLLKMPSAACATRKPSLYGLPFALVYHRQFSRFVKALFHVVHNFVLSLLDEYSEVAAHPRVDTGRRGGVESPLALAAPYKGAVSYSVMLPLLPVRVALPCSFHLR